MIFSNEILLIFAIAFMGCVLATPRVSRIAFWAGAIDRPDQFRRIHKNATPRLGGLSVAFGIALSLFLLSVGGHLAQWTQIEHWSDSVLAISIASLIVIMIGFIDDTQGLGPRVKLIGQTSAVVVLYLGGVHIDVLNVLGVELNLGWPGLHVAVGGLDIPIHPISFVVTLFWFLACMNIWNLIDGMDGLATGVGFLVSGTLALVAIHHNNVEVGVLAAALAGSLAGFLLYNWHPACIFLGDCGSLLIGLLIGVIGVQGSLKGPTSISILFPILAMGLPITDTAMAIFRRWVRNLPLSSADRRHVHHLLIGLGLTPRTAVMYLYCFSGFLCGVVLLGVTQKNEFLALILGISGCLAFLLILTSRRDELKVLRSDFRSRMVRGKQERTAAKITWEAIQRVELCTDIDRIAEILEATTVEFGCDTLRIHCTRFGQTVYTYDTSAGKELIDSPDLSGPTATFRLSSGRDLLLTVSLHQPADTEMAADIAFRFLQRLSLATSERIERLLDEQASGSVAPELIRPEVTPIGFEETQTSSSGEELAVQAPQDRDMFRRLRSAFRGEAG